MTPRERLALYSAALPGPSALRMTRSPTSLRRVAQMLVLAFFAFAVALVSAPWQQNVKGTGRVIAYAPLDRQQPIETPIKGRVTEWKVQEGTHVKAGDRLATVSDNDPQLLQRLRSERDAVQEALRSADLAVLTLESQVVALELVRSSGIAAAKSQVQLSKDKMTGEARKLDGAEAELDTAELQKKRIRKLEEEGLESKRKRELADMYATKAKAEKDRAKAYLAAAKKELAYKKADLDKTKADADAKIADVQAKLRKAEQERAKAKAELQKANIKLAQKDTQVVRAPRDGTIFRILANENTEWVKEGDPIALLVPDTNAPAVELLVDGNDAPLITPGRHVRLQFEGWPAVQFVGWPSVAVGTFPGTVAFVDATDDGNGKFRVVVVPEEGGDPWPEARYLRQGVRANGWVLLNRVTLGFELWRQFNGFPPAVKTEEKKGPKTHYAKKPKPK